MKAFFVCGQFVFGAAAYGLLEVAWRGYTHISMVILGGVCFPVLVRLSGSKRGLPLQCLGGSLFITGAEFATGCVVNLWLELGVWDYTAEPMHLLGQVCLRFSLLWYALCAVLFPLIQRCRSFRPRLGKIIAGLPARSATESRHTA